MGAAEYYGIDGGVGAHQGADVFVDKVVGACAVGLAVFDQGHPHGACAGGDGEAGVDLGQLHLV